jgi:GT2 family glycosyltransferase
MSRTEYPDTKGLVIMLCRNGLHLTRRCFETLLDLDGNVMVLAVDNASEDGTGRWLTSMQSRCNRLLLIHYGEVQSVAQAWNDALNWAWDRGQTEALVVNNDCELLPCTYELLLGRMKTEKLGMVTAVSMDRLPDIPTRITTSPHLDYSCYLISKATHRQVPFDPGYVGAYFEDNDHHVRLHHSGITAVSLSLGFLHHRSSTLKFASPEEQKRINENFAANKERFRRRYGAVPGTKRYEALFAPHVKSVNL